MGLVIVVAALVCWCAWIERRMMHVCALLQAVMHFVGGGGGDE